jgi:hypothetical protein
MFASLYARDPECATAGGGKVTERMITANGVRLCAEPFGDPADPPVLLVHGSGGSMALDGAAAIVTTRQLELALDRAVLLDSVETSPLLGQVTDEGGQTAVVLPHVDRRPALG